MKNITIFIVGVLFVLAMFIPQVIASEENVDVCHLTFYYEPSEPFAWGCSDNWEVAYYGYVINVSPEVAAAHYGHGDPETVFYTDDFYTYIPGFDNDSECVIFIGVELPYTP